MSVVQPANSESSRVGLYPKYEVFKHGENTPIDGDFFVIRESDVFGPAVLYAYASQIQTTLEMDYLYNFLSQDKVEQLITLADDLFERAQQWQKNSIAKVPD